MDQLGIKGKKTTPFDSRLAIEGRPAELSCKICGRKIADGEWATKDVITGDVICEDCGIGVKGENCFSIDE